MSGEFETFAINLETPLDIGHCIQLHRSLAARLPSSVTMMMLSFVYGYVSIKLE